MRASVWSEYEREYRDHIGYKADPLEWLASNWQGAAIGSLIARRPCKGTYCLLSLFVSFCPPNFLFVCLYLCFFLLLFLSRLFIPLFMNLSFPSSRYYYILSSLYYIIICFDTIHTDIFISFL